MYMFFVNVYVAYTPTYTLEVHSKKLYLVRVFKEENDIQREQS